MRETPLVLSQLSAGFKKPLVKQHMRKHDIAKMFMNDFDDNSALLLKSVKKSNHNLKVTGFTDKNKLTNESYTSITQSSEIHMKYNNNIIPHIVRSQSSHSKTIQQIKHWLKNEYFNKPQIGIERTIKETKQNYTVKNVFNNADNKFSSSKTYNVTHCKNLEEYTIKIPRKLLKTNYNYTNKKHVTLPKHTFKTTHDMVKTILKPKVTHIMENTKKELSFEVPSFDWNEFKCKTKSEVNNMLSLKPYSLKDFGVQTDLCFKDFEILIQNLQNKYQEIEKYERGRKEIQNSKQYCVRNEVQNSTQDCTQREIQNSKYDTGKDIQNSAQIFTRNEKQSYGQDCSKQSQEIDSRSLSNINLENYISSYCKNGSFDKKNCKYEDNCSLSNNNTGEKIKPVQDLEKPKFFVTASVTFNISDKSKSIEIDSYNDHLKKGVCEDLCVNQTIIKQTPSFICESDTEKNVSSISEKMHNFSNDLKNMKVNGNQSYARDVVDQVEIFKNISNFVGNINDYIDESGHHMKKKKSPLREISKLDESTHTKKMEVNSKIMEKSHESFISASFQKCLDKEFNQSSDNNQELICTTKSLSILKTPNSYYVENVSDEHISNNNDNSYLKSLKLIKNNALKISDEDESPIILSQNKMAGQIEDEVSCISPVVGRNNEWNMDTDSFGKVFYINSRTGMTVYDKPNIEENTPCPYTICKRPGFLPKGNLSII